MAAVAAIRPYIEEVIKFGYDTVKKSLFKDVKDADWKTVINYLLLAFGFPVTGYLMYRNRSIIFSSIELRWYTIEQRINTRMEVWVKSNRGPEDDKNFIKALRAELPEGSNNVSKDYLSKVLAFIDKYRPSFGCGSEITEIYSSIEPIVYSKEQRINRRMNEWEKSYRDSEDHKNCIEALTSETSGGSNDVSKDCLSKVLSFFERHRESFGNRSDVTEIYSPIESIVYTKEERIQRRMNEWENSNKGMRDHKRFYKALRDEIPEGSNDELKNYLSEVLAFIEKYRESFGYGPDITEIYSPIELMVYTKEERIQRRMNEWENSNKGMRDHKRFYKALRDEIPEGSNDVSNDCLSEVLAFIERYRESFGPDITEIYFSIESMVYTKEERINRRMNEWHQSNKDARGYRFCQALIAESSTGSDLSPRFIEVLKVFLLSNKQSFGPHITIFEICKCVENRIDNYSENGWVLLTLLCGIVQNYIPRPGINYPLLISARDILHNLLRDFPAEATDHLLLQIAECFRFICIYVHIDHATYRVTFPEHVWKRIMDAIDELNSPELRDFYVLIRNRYGGSLIIISNAE